MKKLKIENIDITKLQPIDDLDEYETELHG